MSAVGKLDFQGDFDEQGQLVETPYRPQLAKKSAPVKTAAKIAPRVPESDRQRIVQDYAKPAAQPPMPGPLFTKPAPADLTLDRSRDILLTAFGKATLTDRYLMPGESFQDMFARVSCAYADDVDHAQRLYDAMSQLWFMPATPILSNGGTKRGLPISCFLNDVSDSLDGIVGTWNENVCAGVQWRRHRHLLGQGPLHRREGEDRPDQRHHSLHPCDGRADPGDQPGLAAARLGGGLSRHLPSGDRGVPGDPQSLAATSTARASTCITASTSPTSSWMRCATTRCSACKSPKTGEVLREVNARQLWQRILETRLQTGEPYILNIDAVNRALPKHQRELGLKVNTSNLCSEITLPTGIDHTGNERTAVCCLSSLNIETWDQWADEEGFVEDVLRMLDNVLTSFIETAPDSMKRAKYSRPARALGGPGRDGLSLLPAVQGHPAGKRHGQVVESAHLQEDTPRS